MGLVSSHLLFLLLCLSFLVLLPGLVLVEIIAPEQRWNPLQLLPLLFGVGLGALTVVTIFAYLLQIDLNAYVGTLGVLWSVGLIIYVRRMLGKSYQRDLKGRVVNFLSSPRPSWPLSQVVVGLIALGSGVGMFYTGATSGGDALAHLGAVQRLLTTGMTPSGFMAKTDGINVVYGFSTWWAVLAAMSQVTNLTPDQVWAYLPSLLIPIVFLAWYSLNIELFQDSNAAALSTLLALPLFLWRLRTSALELEIWSAVSIAYPFNVAFYILVPVAIMLYVLSVRLQTETWRWLIGLSVIGTLFVHPLGLLTIFLAIFCLVVVCCVLPGIRLKQLLRKDILAGFFLIPAPFLLGRGFLYSVYFSSHDLVLIASENVARDISADFVDLGWGLTIINPYALLTPLVVVELLAVLWLASRFRRDIGERFLLSNVLVTMFVLLNPITVHILTKMITPNLLRRMGLRWLAMVGILSLGWWGAKVLLRWMLNLGQNKKKEDEKRFKGLFAFSMSALVLTLFIVGSFLAKGVPIEQLPSSVIRPGERHYYCKDPLMEYIAHASGSDSALLLQPGIGKAFGRAIVMCTGRYAVWNRPDVLVLSAMAANKRSAMVEAIFSGEAEESAVISFINQQNIDYFILTEKKKLFVESRYRTLGQALRPVAASPWKNRFYVYRVNRALLMNNRQN